jgi:hypothetical protein
MVATLLIVGTAQGAPPTFTDPIGDSGAAPDITGLTFSYKGGDSDALWIVIDWAGGANLPQNSQIVLGLDTDRNASTGSDNGADYRFIFAPVVGASSKVGVGFERWKGGQYVSWSPQNPGFSASKPGSALFVMCLCDLNNPVSFNLFARSEVQGTTDTDTVPDTGPSLVTVPIVHSILFRPVPFRDPIAGKSFGGVIDGIRLAADLTKVYAASTATCTAKLAGKTLPLYAHCRWHIPAATAGQPLAISIRVVYDGAPTTFTANYKVAA